MVNAIVRRALLPRFEGDQRGRDARRTQRTMPPSKGSDRTARPSSQISGRSVQQTGVVPMVVASPVVLTLALLVALDVHHEGLHDATAV